ncbi:MAG: hypothetical protein JWO82_2159 [Akkermansiaceae bacterium]|nr:hypothetical protein [Akkermansiaceae bacterium]
MSWAAITAVVVVLGAAGTAYSSYEQGQAQDAVGKANAQIAINAADVEAQTASENAMRQREQNKRRLGAIKAQIGGGGTQIGTGSSLDVLSESADELELATLDAFNASDNRQRQFQTQAAMSLFGGQQAATAGAISAGGSLLSGFGSAAGGYYKTTH